MPVFRSVAFQIRPEGLERCRGAIEEFVNSIRGTQPGTQIYVSLQSKQDLTQFLHVMVFADERAEQLHREAPSTAKFTAILSPELQPPASSPDFDPYEVLAGTPL